MIHGICHRSTKAIQRLEVSPAFSKLNSTRSLPTRAPIGPFVWTLLKRVPVPNRPLPSNVHFVRMKEVPGLSTRPSLPTPLQDTIWSPLLSAAIEIAIDFTTAFLIVQLLRFAAKKTNEAAWSGELEPDSGIRRSRNVFGATIQAVTSPSSFVLIGAAVLHSVQVLVERIDQYLDKTKASEQNWLEQIADPVFDVLSRILSPLDGMMEMALKQGLLLALVWFLIALKNELVAWIIEERSKEDPTLVQDIRRLVIPLSSFTTWVIVAGGILAALGLAGFNILPVLQVTGIVGALVTLSSQSFLANLFAGINLFLARPFVAGDRIIGYSAYGALLFAGTVERVNPLRTVIRTDKNYPLTVPNKLLSDMIIGNESRLPTVSLADLNSGRRIGASLTLTRDHFGKLDEIRAMIESLLESFDGMNHEMPHGVNIGSLANDKVTLEIFASAQKREKHKFSELQVRLLQALSEGLRKHGIEDFELAL